MNSEFNTLIRREALPHFMKGTAAALVTLPALVQAASEGSAEAEAAFAPENGHSFLGYKNARMA
jgi:hypothetical protein